MKMMFRYLIGLVLAQNDHCTDQLAGLPRKRFESDVLTSLDAPKCPDACCCDTESLSCEYEPRIDYAQVDASLFSHVYYEHQKQTAQPPMRQSDRTQEYWARHNQLTQLDFDELAKLTSVKMAVFMFNRINSTKFESDGELASLEVLELGENWFTTIDNTMFPMLPNLRNISLANNRIQKVSANAFNSNKNLLELVLRNNHIMSEALPIFDAFENLVKLDLSNNHLSHVSKAYFGKMKKLKVLRLNNNKITYITSLAFHNLAEVEQIDLSVNWLTYINTPVFTPLAIERPWLINFAVNPLICDCTMQPFLIWMTDQQHLSHLANWDKLQCMAGGDTKAQTRFGQLLKDITSERLCQSSLGMIIAIPSAIVGFILLICCIVCVKRVVFSETKEIEEFERNEAERAAVEDADSLGQDEQGNQVGLPVSLMPTVNPDLMADRPEVMAAVRQQQLISSGMDPTHARIHATRAGRDAQAMGYSSSAYGSDDEKQAAAASRQRPDLNSTRRDLMDGDGGGDAPNYSGGPRGSAF